MSWVKKGRIHTPGKFPWARHFGTTPTPHYLKDRHVIRVYYGATDENLKGSVGYLEVDADDPAKVLYEHPEPVLSPGVPGAFDSDGVVPACFLHEGDRQLLYTVGFQRTEQVGPLMFAGLAQKDKDSEGFHHLSHAPILPRAPHRPLMQGAPSVIKEGEGYRMWHWYASEWQRSGTKYNPIYHIGHARSDDGVTWEMDDIACLSPQEGEIGVARPWVTKTADGYEMWFSVRAMRDDKTMAYKGIWHATSEDGYAWQRDDAPCLGAAPSPQDDSGWDAEMTCYGAVVEAKGRRFMLYCGNGNGKTGFGYAEWQP